MRWTRKARDVRAGCVRRSRVVLTPRCWRQAGGKCPAGDGGKRAVHRGELAISRKAIAQGRPECSRCPVCSCAVLFAQIARETAGAASTRSVLKEGKPRCKPRAQMRREKAKVRLRRSYGAAGGQEVRLVVPPTIQPRGSRCLSSIGLTHPPLA